MKKISLYILFIFLTLISCSDFGGTKESPLNTLEKITNSFTPSPTYQLPTSTFKPTFTKNPTRTPTPTYPPIPTSIYSDHNKIIIDLFEKNNDCKFPCWWGIIPGETPWIVAEEFLKPLSEEITFRNNLPYLGKGSERYTISVIVPILYDAGGVERIGFYIDENENVNVIVTVTALPKFNLDLPGFLQEYGAPSQVYIWAFGVDPFTPRSEERYIIALFYENKGILVAYYGRAFMEEETIEICPVQLLDEYASLWLWNPRDELSFESVGEPGLFESESLTFYPIDEISEFTTSEFFNRYKNPNNQNTCFEIQNPDFLD